MKQLPFLVAVLFFFRIGLSHPTIEWSIDDTISHSILDANYLSGLGNSLSLVFKICQQGLTSGVNTFFFDQGKIETGHRDYHAFSLLTPRGHQRVLVLRHPLLIKRIVDVKRCEIARDSNSNLIFSAESELGAPFRDAMMGILTRPHTHDAFRTLARNFLDPKRLDVMLQKHIRKFLDESLAQRVEQQPLTLSFHTLTARIMLDALIDETLTDQEIASIIDDIDYISALIFERLLNPHRSASLLSEEAHKRLNPLIEKIKVHGVLRDFTNDSSLGDADLYEATIAFLFAGVDNVAWALHHLFVSLGDETVAVQIAQDELTSERRLSLIQETLRLWPVIYGLRRDVVRPILVALSEDNTQEKIVLDENSIIYLDTFLANRSQNYFGETAERFLPWRFIDSSAAPPLWYLTFGHDGLGCLGKKITIAIMDKVLDDIMNTRKLRVRSFIDNTRVTDGFHPVKRAFNLRIDGRISYDFIDNN